MDNGLRQTHHRSVAHVRYTKEFRIVGYSVLALHLGVEHVGHGNGLYIHESIWHIGSGKSLCFHFKECIYRNHNQITFYLSLTKSRRQSTLLHSMSLEDELRLLG
jgi:hypothetical protein